MAKVKIPADLNLQDFRLFAMMLLLESGHADDVVEFELAALVRLRRLFVDCGVLRDVHGDVDAPRGTFSYVVSDALMDEVCRTTLSFFYQFTFTSTLLQGQGRPHLMAHFAMVRQDSYLRAVFTEAAKTVASYRDAPTPRPVEAADGSGPDTLATMTVLKFMVILLLGLPLSV